MTNHILNRQGPPAMPKRPAPPKKTPEQLAIDKRLQRTKAAEAVGRAIERTRR